MTELTKCDSCGKEIPEGEEYVDLSLSRQVLKDNVVTVLSSHTLTAWCIKCYDRLQALLKLDVSEMLKTRKGRI